MGKFNAIIKPSILFGNKYLFLFLFGGQNFSSCLSHVGHLSAWPVARGIKIQPPRFAVKHIVIKITAKRLLFGSYFYNYTIPQHIRIFKAFLWHYAQ